MTNPFTIVNGRIPLLTGPLDPSNTEDTLNNLIQVLNGIPAIASRSRINVAAAATLTLSSANDGQTIVLSRAAGIAVTLPAATGSGLTLNFVTGTTITSNTTTIAAVAATDIFAGFLLACSTAESPDLAQPWVAASNSNLMTFNGSTQGGIKGEFYTLRDTASGVWTVSGNLIQSGAEATPFSHV